MYIRIDLPLGCAMLNNKDEVAQRRANSIVEPDESPVLPISMRDPIDQMPRTRSR